MRKRILLYRYRWQNNYGDRKFGIQYEPGRGSVCQRAAKDQLCGPDQHTSNHFHNVRACHDRSPIVMYGQYWNLRRADWNTSRARGDVSAGFDHAAKRRHLYDKLSAGQPWRDKLHHASHGGYHQLHVGRGHADRKRNHGPASPVENRNRERAVQHMAVSISCRLSQHQNRDRSQHERHSLHVWLAER